MNRSETYMARVVADALENTVFFDADVIMQKHGKKIKAYCPQTGTYLQFPRSIRQNYKKLVADVVKSSCKRGKTFYRAYPGSIRETKDSQVLE